MNAVCSSSGSVGFANGCYAGASAACDISFVSSCASSSFSVETSTSYEPSHGRHFCYDDSGCATLPSVGSMSFNEDSGSADKRGGTLVWSPPTTDEESHWMNEFLATAKALFPQMTEDLVLPILYNHDFDVGSAGVALAEHQTKHKDAGHWTDEEQYTFESMLRFHGKKLLPSISRALNKRLAEVVDFYYRTKHKPTTSRSASFSIFPRQAFALVPSITVSPCTGDPNKRCQTNVSVDGLTASEKGDETSPTLSAADSAMAAKMMDFDQETDGFVTEDEPEEDFFSPSHHHPAEDVWSEASPSMSVKHYHDAPPLFL